MTDMASNHGKITRVFPRRTAATPEDPYAFTGPPPCGELPDISEVHISVTFTYDMEEQEARLVQNILNLTEEEVRLITRFRRGEGLLCIGHNHVPISVFVSPKEYEAITTSPTDRRARNNA